MSATPQPPRPPVPPAPSRVLPIILLSLALIVVLSALAVWIGLRVLSHAVRVRVDEGKGGNKEVSIQTPVGSFEAAKGVDEARLGLPIYPGAKQMKDAAATVNFSFGGETNMHLVVGKFETSDPIEKVTAFYRNRLGSQVTKFTEKNSEGKTLFEVKRPDQEKIVALKDEGSGTRLELVRVVHGRAEAN
jgi:hypothetical protein